MISVTVWNENLHEKQNPKVNEIYPEGLHIAIAKGIAQEDFEIRTATLDQPEHGLTEDVLNNTDVLIWWGHMGHDKVEDEIVERVQKRVLAGMGIIVLHSGHFSKIFKKLMGTSCDLNGEKPKRKKLSGLSIQLIQLQKVLVNTLKLKKKKCTASTLISQLRMSLSL